MNGRAVFSVGLWLVLAFLLHVPQVGAAVTTYDLATTNNIHIDALGAANSDTAGTSVASAGDVNGDGTTDVLVGVPNADNNGRSGSGSVYVVYGSATGRSVDFASFGTSDGYRIDGAEAGDAAGTSVANAGDVNGDGVPDHIIGAPHTHNSAYLANNPGADESEYANAGSAYIVYGRRSGLLAPPPGGGNFIDLETGAGPGTVDFDATVGYRYEGSVAGYLMGNSVAGAGDVNGDGVPDQLVGSPGAWNDSATATGVAYVFYGRRAGILGPVAPPDSLMPGFPPDIAHDFGPEDGYAINGFTQGPGFAGFTQQTQFGYSVSNAGDVNGDGVPDQLVGAPAMDFGATGTGSAWVVYGRRAGLLEPPSLTESLATYVTVDPNGTKLEPGSIAPFTTADGYRIDGVGASDATGTAVAGAGDVNGDGLPDALIGTPGADNNGRAGSGSAHIVYGRRTGTLAPPTSAANNFIRLDPSGAAAAGAISPFTTDEGYRVDGAVAGDAAGTSVATVGGDLNSDGVADQLIGAPGADNNSRSGSGSIYAVYGRRSGGLTPPASSVSNFIDLNGSGPTNPFSTTDGYRVDGAATSDSLGTSVAGIADISGDGRVDLLAGAPTAGSGGQSDAGMAYVLTFESQAPAATTDVASGITASGATLNGSVNPNGQATTYEFEYGLTAAYGSTTTGGSAGSGSSSGPVSEAVSGLSACTTYHFRINATNATGTTNGSDQTFTTTGCSQTPSDGGGSDEDSQAPSTDQPRPLPPNDPGVVLACTRPYAPSASASVTAWRRLASSRRMRLQAIQSKYVRLSGKRTSVAFRLQLAKANTKTASAARKKEKIRRVTFYLNGRKLSVDRKAPFRVRVRNLTKLGSGMHTVKAVITVGKATRRSAKLAFGLVECEPASFQVRQSSRKAGSLTRLTLTAGSGGHAVSAVSFTLPRKLRFVPPARKSSKAKKSIGRVSIRLSTGAVRTFNLKLAAKRTGRARTLLKVGKLQVKLSRLNGSLISVTGMPQGAKSLRVTLGVGKNRLLRNSRSCGKLAYKARVTTPKDGSVSLINRAVLQGCSKKSQFRKR